ncbi:MAG TPA: hypothetical protein VMX79_00045 [bacterium]|nr:hypothetical protein [bacterium]
MRFKIAGLAALAVALVIVAGCINYDQELTLNTDGSGTIKIRYDRTGGSTGEEKEGEGSLDLSAAPKLSFTEKEIMAEYEGAPVTVRDIEIGETDAGVPEATYYIDFNNITDLNGRGVFALEGEKLKQTFSLDTAGDTQVFKQLVQLKMDIEDPSQLSDYKFNYILNAPAEVVENNGTATGNTVKWEYSLDKLINTDTEMTATYKAAAPGAGGKIAVIIGIILCVIIVIVIIIVIIVLLTKKKKKPAGPAPTPTPPSEPEQPSA